jgi:ParB/RepB/Spo0J family partition protein
VNNLSVVFVPISKITMNRFQKETGLDLEKLKEIMESVQRDRDNGTKGIQQVCKARKVGDAYELMFGRHRLMAFQELAKDDLFFDEFPLLVVEATDQEMFEAMGTENLSRREISLVEVGEIFQDYMEKFNATSVVCGQKFCKSEEYVRSAVRMAKAPEVVRENLKADKITVTTARDLLVVHKLLGEEGISDAMAEIEHEIFDNPQDAIASVLRESPKTVELPNEHYPSSEWVTAKKYPYKHLPVLGVQSAAKFIGFELKIHSDKQYLQNRIDEFKEGKPLEEMPAWTSGSLLTRLELEKLQVLMRPSACTACPFHAVFDGDHYCGLPPCKERKEKGWKAKVLEEKIKEIGIKVYEKSDGDFVVLKRHHAPDQKLFQSRHADLRLMSVGNRNWEHLDPGHNNLQVVLIGKTAQNRIKAQQGDLEKGNTENLNRQMQVQISHIAFEHFARFEWEVASRAFESALDGVTNLSVLKEMCDMMGFYHDAGFPEGVDEDDLIDSAVEKMKKADGLKQIRRLIMHHTVYMASNDKGIRRRDQKKPIVKLAEGLRGIASEWGVKLPKDWIAQAEKYQADLDAALKELKVQG